MTRFPNAGPPMSAGGSHRTAILYVDDEPTLLALTKLFLERQGPFSVETAESASTALEKCAAGRYDAIVSDYQMPGMSGIEFLRVLRSAGDSTPFVIFTGKGREEVVIEAIDSGADFYVQKGGNPTVQYAELIHKINQAIGRRAAENALRESEERFKAIFAGQQNGILIIDPSEHRVVDANPYLCALIGLPREAIAGHVCHTFVCPAELGSCPITDLNQQIDHSERFLVAADGSKLPVVKTVSRVRFGDREYLVENIQDITERKESERALRESEEKYRALFAAESDGIFVFERETGTIIDCNEAVTGMYGYRKEELIGLSNTVLSAEPEATRAFTQDPSASLPVRRHLRKDGAVFLVEITANVISLKGRDVIVTAIRDISDRRRVEEALASANRRLSLMSTITRHDINNQIAIIQGYLALLGGDRPDPSLDEYLRPIETAAERINAIVRFTATYETIGVHAPVWQDLRTLVKTAVCNARRGRISIECTLPADIDVFADPLIEKVISNLLDNAVRHGGTVTRVRFSAEMRDRTLVLVCEDDGAGVPAEEKERIFERGFGKNTGLGLFLAREILGITGITIREIGTSGARFEIAVPPDGNRLHANSGDASAEAVS